MSQIKICPVQNKREENIFLTFPWKIYKDDKLWVPPILSDRRKTIDPKQGAFFQRGQAEFFIAWRDGKAVGTICAAIDHKANKNVEKKDCLWGFFECIEDYQVAEALWEHVSEWARQHGMDQLYGPFNLDYEDGYGILVEGRDRPPVILCGHTPAYYLEFVERYGFRKGRGQNLAFAFDLQDTPEVRRLARIADRARAQGRVTIRSANLNDWDNEVANVLKLLNAALAHLDGHIPWQPEALSSILEPFKELADPDLVLFAEVDGEVVGFFPGVKNFNEVLIHANGLRYPWNYVSAWWHNRKQPECLSVKSVLVLPEYWGSAVAVLLFDEMIKRAMKKGYSWLDLSLTAEDNPKTPQLALRMGSKVYKRYQVYRINL